MNDLALSEETAISPDDVIMDGETFTEQDWSRQADEVIVKLNDTGDKTEIENFIANLNAIEKISSRVKAKTIYAYSLWYVKSGQGEDFADWYIQSHGGEKLTVQKHQAIGELLLSENVPDEVKQLNTGQLVSVSRALQSGYDLTESWDEIAHAGSEAEVNQIVRKVKGKPERQGTLNIKVYQDGSIMGFMGDAVANLGWLNVTDRDNETDEDKKKVLQIGIARIINNGRMKEA